MKSINNYYVNGGAESNSFLNSIWDDFDHYAIDFLNHSDRDFILNGKVLLLLSSKLPSAKSNHRKFFAIVS
jgi:hypothetical protein